MLHGRMLFSVAFYLDFMLFQRLENMFWVIFDSLAFSEGSAIHDLRFFSFILGPFGILAPESSFNVNWLPLAAPWPTSVLKLSRCRDRSAITFPFATGKHAVLALFSFMKGSGKALFFGQNLLRKSSVLSFVCPFSTVGDTGNG